MILLQDHGSEHQEQLPGDRTELNSTKHCSNNHVEAANSPPPTPIVTIAKRHHVIPPDTKVFIKREPESDDGLSSPSKSGPVFTSTKSDCHSQMFELKPRLSQSAKTDMSTWSSLNGTDDTRDELKLTAYDVIAGVISTPPIQPLEQDTDTLHTSKSVSPSSSSNRKAGESSTVPTTPTVSTTTTTASLPLPSVTCIKSKKNQHTLVQDLDDFSKVMDQVTQEQIAKERRDSFASEVESPPVYPGQSRSAHLLESSPYLVLSQPCLQSQNSSDNYYHQKYARLQAPSHPSQTQVDSAYQPKGVPKSQLILPTPCVLNDPPTSSSNHLPTTPTTPLEHFSSFQCPPPPPLLSLAPPPNHSTPTLGPGPATPRACPPPPPYSSTNMCYSYGHEAIHQAASSDDERWPLPSHAQQPLQHSVLSEPTIVTASQQEKTVLAHASSHVVTLAGRKRPVSEYNGSVHPPTKLQRTLLDHHSDNSGHLHRYHGAPPYPGVSTPGPAAPPFPHQPL